MESCRYIKVRECSPSGCPHCSFVAAGSFGVVYYKNYCRLLGIDFDNTPGFHPNCPLGRARTTEGAEHIGTHYPVEVLLFIDGRMYRGFGAEQWNLRQIDDGVVLTLYNGEQTEDTPDHERIGQEWI